MMLENLAKLLEGVGYKVISIDQSYCVDGPIINTINAVGFGENTIIDRAAVLSHLSNAGYYCSNININIERGINEHFTIGNRTPHISMGPVKVNLTADVLSLTPMFELNDTILTEENDNFDFKGAL